MASPGRALIQTHGQPAKIWMIAIPRHGSKPARTAVIRKPYRIRAEFFALPFAAPPRFASTPLRPFAPNYPDRRFSASDMARSINNVARCCVPWSKAAFADLRRWMSLLSRASFTALTKVSICCLSS